jgi:hypothetical protein
VLVTTPPKFSSAPSVKRAAGDRLQRIAVSRALLYVLPANRDKREPTSGLEPLTRSLRVIHQALQECARDCKCRIFRGVSFPCLAACCTVLRSQWYQSGIKRPLLMHRGRYPTSALSMLSPFPECEGTPHLCIASLTGYRAWVDMPPKGWTGRWASDGAYRRVQSQAGNVRDPIQGCRGSEAFTIPYIDPRQQNVGVDHRVWLR